MKDSFGKEWFDYDNDPLNKFIKVHRLQLTIEYVTDLGKLYFVCQVKDKKYKEIFHYKDVYPLNDSEILAHLKNIVRDKKINMILK